MGCVNRADNNTVETPNVINYYPTDMYDYTQVCKPWNTVMGDVEILVHKVLILYKCTTLIRTLQNNLLIALAARASVYTTMNEDHNLMLLFIKFFSCPSKEKT